MKNEAKKKQNGPARLSEDRLDELLRSLGRVDLPPFYRTRLLAKLREASRRRTWGERLRTPQLAWSVAAVSVLALVLVTMSMRRGHVVPVPVPSVRMVATNIDPVMPVDNSVVGAGEVEIVAAIDPPVEGGVIRLYVDERDVTGLAEVTSDYVMYTPREAFEEGQHIVTIEIRDAQGRKLTDVSWLFYTLGGKKSAPDERV